jgi:translation initiation factor eIF-2B subunit beta
MANGGLVTHSGTQMILLAAAAHSIPVLVVSGMYKLTPLHPFDYSTYNELLSPELIYKMKTEDRKDCMDILVPRFDYVPPENVNLYVTNFGAHTPNYIYRLFSEHYSQEDIYEEDEG